MLMHQGCASHASGNAGVNRRSRGSLCGVKTIICFASSLSRRYIYKVFRSAAVKWRSPAGALDEYGPLIDEIAGDSVSNSCLRHLNYSDIRRLPVLCTAPSLW